MKQFVVDGADALEQACSESFVPLRVNAAATSLRGELLHAQITPGVGMARGTCGRSELVRTPRLVAEQPREDVLLSLFTHGRGEIRQSGRAAVLGSGAGALYDAARPYTLSFPGPMSQLVLQVPRRSLGLRDQVIDQVVARPLAIDDNRPLRVLRSVLEAGTEQSADPRDGESLADVAVTLVRSVILAADPAGNERELSRDVQRELMLDFLRSHHADPGLTPAEVAAAHRVSLRYLQALFAEVGLSPAAYLRGYRLGRARELLRGGSTVSSAASRCGFLDVGTFTRGYRRQHGYPPSEERARSAIGPRR